VTQNNDTEETIMGTSVRLFGAIYPRQPKKITGLTLRISARDIPHIGVTGSYSSWAEAVAANPTWATLHTKHPEWAGSALIDVTDIQLDPGSFVTGWTLAPPDLGVQPVNGWQFRNGVIKTGHEVILVADVDSASPTRWDIRGGNPVNVQVGSYHFGSASSGSVDGWAHTATQGAGIPPHITANADVDVAMRTSGRISAVCWIRGLTLVEDTGWVPPTHVDQGTLLGAHTSWSEVLAWHDTWADLIATHTLWI